MINSTIKDTNLVLGLKVTSHHSEVGSGFSLIFHNLYCKAIYDLGVDNSLKAGCFWQTVKSLIESNKDRLWS